MAENLALSPEDRARIAEAVALAEDKTSAEIRVAVTTAPLVGHSHHIALWAALIALLVPWGLLAIAPLPAARLLAMQAATFLILCAIFTIPPLARGLIPRREKKIAANALARHVFLAHGLHQTEQRTGILIFVAPADRLVEVVADTGVHELLGAKAWQQICDAVAEKAGQGGLVEGIIAGVALSGELLAMPMPSKVGDKNEVPDRVVVL